MVGAAVALIVMGSGVTSGCAVPSSADDPAVVPPLDGQAAIEAWLTAGYYLRWSCEPAAHDADAPSPHGRVRVCENPIAQRDPRGVDQLDAALVIEIVDASGQLTGRGAQRHTQPTADAASWYWYLRVPADSATVHDAGGLAADGWGFEGPPQTYCGACHQMAGAGLPGHDFVFALPGGPGAGAPGAGVR